MEHKKNGEPTKLKVHNNIWFWYLQCCDCGLVHLLLLKSTKKGLSVYAYRDDQKTKKARKKKD